jgi:hypothetical protein
MGWPRLCSAAPLASRQPPRLRQLGEEATGCGDGGVEAAQLAEALEVCEAKRVQWLKWLSPVFRKNQRIVDDKQLPCVGGKFVSRAYNAELINRASPSR